MTFILLIGTLFYFNAAFYLWFPISLLLEKTIFKTIKSSRIRSFWNNRLSSNTTLTKLLEISYSGQTSKLASAFITISSYKLMKTQSDKISLLFAFVAVLEYTVIILILVPCITK